MARIKVSINQKLAVLAGKEKWGETVVNIPLADLTEAQRATLLKFEDYDYKEQTFDFRLTLNKSSLAPYPFYENVYWQDEPQFAEIGTLEMQKLLDYYGEKLATIEVLVKEKEAKEKAEALEKNEKAVANMLVMGLRCKENYEDNKLATHYFNGSKWQLTRELENFNDDRLVELKKAAQLECNRLNAEAEEAREQAKAQADVKKESAIEKICKWTGNWGSELLRARIEGGYEWVGLAEQEYGEWVVNGLGQQLEIPEYIDHDNSERTTPTLEEIQELKKVKELLKDQPATAKLIWAKYEIDQNYDNTFIKRPEIEVTVTCPTGRELTYYYAATANVAV